jgi:hypothetical protein
MASTYSTSLKLELIGNGDQSGTWGTTTNNNFGTLVEQAITGVETITMVNANYTLTSFNGASDEARNAVITATGTNSAVRDIIIPSVNKTYIINNSTTGGFAVNVRTSSGGGIQVPNGAIYLIYCDGTSCYAVSKANSASNVPDTLVLRDGSGNFAAGTITASGLVVSGTATGVTPTVGDNTTKFATTAFVQTVAGNLGTISTQNANNVNITGGTIANVAISSSTIGGLSVGTNATGNRTISTGGPSGGSNGDVWYQY